MINFYYQKSYNIKNIIKIKAWLVNSISELNKELGKIDYVFCDNAFITEVNKKHLQHDYPTDIITFDYVKNNKLNAEIYISIEQVRMNAKLFHAKYSDELHRVLIHGILHLSGFNDHTDEEKVQMRQAEDYYLSLRPF